MASREFLLQVCKYVGSVWYNGEKEQRNAKLASKSDAWYKTRSLLINYCTAHKQNRNQDTGYEVIFHNFPSKPTISGWA